VTAVINYGLVILFELIYKQSIPWTTVLLPIVILPMLFLIAGLSWFLSSLGVFIRDIGHAMGVIIQALMLLSPIFYPAEVVPKAFRWFYHINPINYYIENVRNVLILGQLPNIYTYLLQIMVAILLMFAGWLWFKKTKNSFADVM
jgi:lipopolysaccharide transport system permease protein